jgi:hypothetical protein
LFVACVVAAGCGHKEPEYPPGTTHPTSAEQPAPTAAQPQPKAPPIEPKTPVTPPAATAPPTPAPMTTAPATMPPSGAAPMPGPAEVPAPSETATAPDDRTITKNVRTVIIADKTLSPNAKAIRITTVHGRVTLHGTVLSEQEKLSIENKVKGQRGVVSVDDLLIVKKKK